ncbi:MAG: hypothetical protein V7709_13905 [Halioglobus sp.]
MKNSDGNQMKFEYEGDNLRINTGQQGSYMVINNSGMYVVSDAGGTPMVIDAGEMMGMFGDMAATAPSIASSEIVSLEATGKHENNAGIEGEIYKLEYIDNNSEDVQTAELVLSDDPRAIKMSRAISGFAAAMVKAMGQNPKGANDLEKEMAKLDKGVLRYGDDMWVTAISDRTIGSDRFVLPAPAQDLSAMSGIADAISNAQSSQTNASSTTGQTGEATQKKGLVTGFLSAFGRKADDQATRQQDRAEDQADDAIDQASDEAVDSVLDKAMGKLFGN